MQTQTQPTTANITKNSRKSASSPAIGCSETCRRRVRPRDGAQRAPAKQAAAHSRPSACACLRRCPVLPPSRLVSPGRADSQASLQCPDARLRPGPTPPTKHPTKRPTRPPTKRPTWTPTKVRSAHLCACGTRPLRPSGSWVAGPPTNCAPRFPFAQTPTPQPTRTPTTYPTMNPTRTPTKYPTKYPTGAEGRCR